MANKTTEIETRTIAVLVDNEPGVLARVIGLFSGRGYNIESLTVTEVDPRQKLSRITVITSGTPQILEQLEESGTWDLAAYVPVSALERDGTERILNEIDSLLDEGPQFFPTDAHMDQPERFHAAELIREKFLYRLREELPHSLAIVVEEIESRDNDVVYVAATALVERKSQKGIVIGKGGSLLREVGAEARADLERLFGSPVYLDIRVKVEEDWQRRDQALDRLGF